MQNDAPVSAHPGVTGQRALPILRRQVPFAGLDLSGPPRVGPPRVRLRDEAAARVQARVIHRVGYPLALYQRAQISFRGGPDAVADFRQDLAEARRTLNRPPGELVRELRNLDDPPLHAVGHDGADTSEVSHAADGVR